MRAPIRLAVLAALPLALATCTVKLDPVPTTQPPPQAKNLLATGFTGDLDWDLADGGVNGVGAGADGQGGIAIGGKVFGATVEAWLADGELLGSAPTDATTGLVTAKPSPTYTGWLYVVVKGSATATIYDEGLDDAVPFPEGRTLHAWVPILRRNVGVNAFTEAAHQLLTAGSTPERVDGVPTPAQLLAAHDRVRGALNAFLPASLQLDDLTRLPAQRSAKAPGGSLGSDPRGRLALVEGALSKLAQRANGASPTPGLDAADELAEDLKDGRLDGRNGASAAAPSNRLAYAGDTFGTELVSGLAQQAERFGKAEVMQKVPPIVSFGNTRYLGYLFDGSVNREGQAYSTVAGWVAGNSLGKSPGSAEQKVAFALRSSAILANMGHGGGYFKTDDPGKPTKVYAIGDNVNGELGTGNLSPSVLGTELTTLPVGPTLTHAAGGFAHTLSRLSDGRVFAWGDNAYGQLGQGKSPAELRRSLTPLQVALPHRALSVAASTYAAYALLDDGTVWAWGAEGGFGLLGDGLRTGTATSPAAVPGLTGVVQLAARDLDVVVLKNDGTVWQWGSFPSPDPAFVAGDPSKRYAGGNLSPTKVDGLPAGLAVKKLLTEQGVFAALLENGHVYEWGTHFDITAGKVLDDLVARRVLGLPPLRDLLPGGYVGYGFRAFDRQTALGVDFAGGYWKVRGRVAEAFDPAQPTNQHRPLGQGPRVDCSVCHQFFDRSLVEYQALQPSTAGLPACSIPANVHQGPVGSLVRAETVCIQCHNPARLDYLPPQNPSGKVPFDVSGAWPNCSTPTDLPPRGFNAPPLVTTACTVPPKHLFTPPGTVCATCHQSVLAPPLNTLQPPCAQPDPALLPTLETTATVDGATDAAALPIPAGGLTATASPVLHGTLSAPLQAGESLEVDRSGFVAGTASASGTTWSFTDAAPDGDLVYTAHVVGAGATFGATSNAFGFSVDATPPFQTAAITGFQDDLLGAVAPGGFATDTTPGLAGTLSAGLGAGERLQVLRNGSVVGSATVSGTGWTYAEPAALALAAYQYAARVIDLAGNVGATSPPAQLTLVGTLPTVTVTQVAAAGVPLASGASTTSKTLAVSGTLSASLQAGWSLRVRRDGIDVGAATATGTAWTFTDSSLADGSHTWTARVEAGIVLGNLSGPWTVIVDTVPPAQSASATLISDDFNGALADGATTADPTPLVSGTVSAALGTGEQVQVLRNGTAVATVAASGLSWSYAEPTSLANGTYAYTARVVDAAAQLGPATGASRSVIVNTSSIPLIGAATTLATVNGVAPAGSAVPLNNVRTPALAGTIQRALVAGEVVKVYRDNVAIGNATVTTTSWTFTSASLADGTYAFRAQVEQAANPAVFGLTSASVSDPIDGTVPTQGATITTIYDNSGALAVRTDTFSTDTTPRVDGTLTAALGATDYLRLTRDGAEIAKLRNGAGVTGTAFTFVESTPLALGVHTYGADVRDDAGNLGSAAASPTHTVNLITQASLPSATVTSAAVSGTGSPGKPNGTVVATGGAIPDTTPTLTVTLGAALPAGYQVEVLRDGAQAGTPLSTCASPCAFTDAGATQGAHAYTVRTIAGPVLGTTSATAYNLTVDTVAPAQTVTLNQARSNVTPNSTVAGAVPPDAFITNGGNTNDPNPTFRFTLSGALGAGESVSVRRAATPLAPTLNAVCGANCWEFLAATGVTIQTPVSNPDGSLLPAYNPASPPLQSGTAVSFSVRVVDLAGNESVAATWTVNVGYLRCDQVRADTASGGTGFHSTLSFAAASTGRCANCHITGPSHPLSPAATPAGFFVAVPFTTATYWCGRPP